ncbi:MAG: phosphatidyl-myo-inositol alpha-mannosyltransferase [Solirubrobacteraceae bacterium]|nr:phosphatidyl-myo-inositol alpha-mannosyltransferase [Solirubrobacteraceae bacterium]
MRIALVSPYSWTYPGGVTRHIEALADEFLAAGHDVRVLAPYDPPDALSARLHRGAHPQPREVPDHFVSLGRTIGLAANGAVSNVALTPFAVTTLRTHLATGGFDVVHVHEPVCPVIGWDALLSSPAPLVGTFHCYSENRLTNNAANVIGARRRLNRLRVRIAVSEAAAWTGKRFFGGRYRVIPNGVHVPITDERPSPLAIGNAQGRSSEQGLRIVFVGQAVERKGLPVLLRAFEALREHVPATLSLVGVNHDEIEPMLLDDRGVTALGKVSDAEKAAQLAQADVLCAPSLGGESFGMVLTESFAAGTPVVASDIPGYSDVVRDGVEGVLVPRGDAVSLAETLRDFALDPARRERMGRAAAERARRYAWPHVAEEVLDAYEDAIAVPEAEGRLQRAAVSLGAVPADLAPTVRARRLPTLQQPVVATSQSRLAAARRIAIPAAAAGAVALAYLALGRIGLENIGTSLLHSSPVWILTALGLMCTSMVLRALSWHAILRAALPGLRVRRTDALQGTFIGVLMSATLPARLGEPSRALIVARRLGRARDKLPVVLGTIVSQTLLNLVALAILGIVMFSSVHLFDGHHRALLAAAIAPVAVLVAVVGAPILLTRGVRSRFARVHAFLVEARAALTKVRDGLRVFRNPRLGTFAAGAQLTAWAIQWMSCYVLLVALGLDDRAGIGAAAAVLFAVNVTAVLPATPSNLGIFQAACVAVLGAYHVGAADALAYGIILQAVEVATAVVMGTPALVKEGLSWREVRLRAMHAAPVKLPARGDAVEAEA